MPKVIVWNRAPLPPNRLAPLPPAAIRLRGTLLDAVRAEKPEGLADALQRACLAQEPDAVDAAERALLARMQQEAAPDKDLLRALLHYHQQTADKRVAMYLLGHARSLREALAAGRPVSAREAADLGDTMQAMLRLYNLTGQRSLLELLRQLKATAPDWMSTLHVFPYTKPAPAGLDPQTDAYWRAHGGVIASSLKTPAMQALFEGGRKNETAFQTGWAKLMQYHGAAHGLFNADPLLLGAHPSRTVSAEVAREVMVSLSALLWAQGQAMLGDLIERVALGALHHVGAPQAANQLSPGAQAPAPMSLYASSLWMATRDEGLAVLGYAPCEVRWRLAGRPVRVQVDTDYPLGEEVRITVSVKEPLSFALYLRIPEWAQGAVVTCGGVEAPCRAGAFQRIERVWRAGDVLTLTLPMTVRVVTRYHQSVSVERGPLTYALDASGGANWQVALLPAAGFVPGSAKGIPTLEATVADIPWDAKGGIPAAPPIAPRVRSEGVRRVTLWPYAAVGARIAQFPVGVIDPE